MTRDPTADPVPAPDAGQRNAGIALSDRLTVAKAIYDALPLTRPLVMPQAPGTSTGVALPTPVVFIMPVSWEELPTLDQQRYLAAAEAVEKAQLAGILADIDEADRAAGRAFAEHEARQRDAREAAAERRLGRIPGVDVRLPFDEAQRETLEAVALADRVLDEPHIDPDSDIAVLARQLLRTRERWAHTLKAPAAAPEANTSQARDAAWWIDRARAEAGCESVAAGSAAPEAGRVERIDAGPFYFHATLPESIVGKGWQLVGPDGHYIGPPRWPEDDARAFAVLFTAQPRGGAGAVPFQARVAPWVSACFGDEVACDELERMDRFVEEVFEAVQSRGYDPARIRALIDYVYGREPGETHQEIGGVMMTLAAWCNAIGQDMHEAGEAELTRVWGKVEQIRAKQAAKPKGSALPVALADPRPGPRGAAPMSDLPIPDADGKVMLTDLLRASMPAAVQAMVDKLSDWAGVEIDYTNHKGERGTRRIIPNRMLLPGDDTYHPGARWVIEAWDVAKGAMRTFDPAHIHRWGEWEARSSAKVFRQALADAKASLAEAGFAAPADADAGEAACPDSSIADHLDYIEAAAEAVHGEGVRASVLDAVRSIRRLLDPGRDVAALIAEARRERQIMFMAPSGGNAGDPPFHAANWRDKPSRVLYDACKLIDRLCDALTNEAALRPVGAAVPGELAALSAAARDVLAERRRQVEQEGWTPEHDDSHRSAELAAAAASYAVGGGLFRVSHLQVPMQVWPYRWQFKPTTHRRNCVIAAALLLAEIERLDRPDRPTPAPGVGAAQGEGA